MPRPRRLGGKATRCRSRSPSRYPPCRGCLRTALGQRRKLRLPRRQARRRRRGRKAPPTRGPARCRSNDRRRKLTRILRGLASRRHAQRSASLAPSTQQQVHQHGSTGGGLGVRVARPRRALPPEVHETGRRSLPQRFGHLVDLRSSQARNLLGPFQVARSKNGGQCRNVNTRPAQEHPWRTCRCAQGGAQPKAAAQVPFQDAPQATNPCTARRREERWQPRKAGHRCRMPPSSPAKTPDAGRMHVLGKARAPPGIARVEAPCAAAQDLGHPCSESGSEFPRSA